jgi:predicted Zn-dependent peptidase
MKQPRVFSLPNGLQVVLAPQPDALTATAVVMVRAGSEYETREQNGVSHFLEHLVFKGTKKYPRVGQVSEVLEGMGAETNAWTAESHTAYWAKAQSGKAGKLLEVVSELHLDPLLDADEIERERGVVIEEIAMYDDMPNRKVYDVWGSLLYGEDQPAGRPIAGPKENIRALTREQITGYRASRYRAPETVVSIAGGFDAAEVSRFIKRRFANLDGGRAKPKPKTRESQAKPNVKFVTRPGDQAHMVLGFRAFKMGDRREHALSMLATVLGGGMSSRLFKRIRDELGAAYYVHAWNDASVDHGSLGVSVGANLEKAPEVVAAVMEEYARLATELVDVKELRRARDYQIGGFLMGLESSDALATHYGSSLLLRGRVVPVRETIAAVKAVTPEEIRRVARMVIREEALNLAGIGPGFSEAQFRKLLKLR